MTEPVIPDRRPHDVWSGPQEPSNSAWARILRFGISGACATIFYFLATNALHYLFQVPPGASSLIGYLMSVVLSYLLQSRFTFRMKTDTSRQVGRFLAATFIGLGVAWGLVRLLNVVLGYPMWVGTLAVCVAIPLLNYALFHLWVFVRVAEEGNSE